MIRGNHANKIMGPTLISANQPWLIWMVIILVTTWAIWGEQKYKWGGQIGGSIIAIFTAMFLVNINVIPASSPVHAAVNGYILPLSIPLLLFQCDLRKIIAKSGKLAVIFFVAAVGTLIGVGICGMFFKGTPGVAGIAAMTTGAHIGGTVNMVAMGATFNMGADYTNACAIAANLILAFYMLILSAAANSSFIRKTFPHPYIDKIESGMSGDESMAAHYWKPKDISLLSFGMSLATGVAITALSWLICQKVNATNAPFIIKQLFGSIYLVMTLVTVIAVTAFPKYFEKLRGAEELGNYAIMMFFTCIGCAADLVKTAQVGSVVIIFICSIMVTNFCFTMLVAKLMGWSYEEASCCCNATFGGPTTAAAYSINKGWHDLVVPCILVGLLGYIVGNYFGVFIGNLLS
ncbi:MAG: DUF819 family protein [Phascolarctobacterium sp.]|nr:DUF819 family protein [Phascolarctobacterium sp.]